jgi:hypothetical protein
VLLRVIFSLKHFFRIIVYPHDGPPINRIKVFKLSAEHSVALLHRDHHIEHSKPVPAKVSRGFPQTISQGTIPD